jgi:hypothetical protein
VGRPARPQAANQRYKQEIEGAWERAGLPTFLGYLKDYIENGEGRIPGAGPAGG